MTGLCSIPARLLPISPRIRAAALPCRFGLLCLLAPCAIAQTPLASVHGTVVNEVSHQPIAHALVTLPQYGAAMLTDNEGRFSFDNVPVGQVSLDARRPGYSMEDGPKTITLASSGTSSGGSDWTLELTPEASLTGELVLSGDDPPDGMRVQLLQRQIQNGRGAWTNYRNAEVSNDGHFRFGNLPAGAYLVHVGASLDPAPYAPEGAPRMRTGYVPAYYPGVREIGGATPIPLAAGSQQDVQLPLTRELYYPVALPVANGGAEARGMSFQVSSDSFLGLRARYSTTDGLVHMELPNGHYTLEGQSYGEHAMSGTREFDVSGTPNLTHILVGPAIGLVPSGRIPVSVHTEFTHTGTPTYTIDGVATAPTAMMQMNLDLQREGGGGQGRRGGRQSMQDDENSRATGISQLSNLAPGRYWVNARSYSGYVAALSSGGVDLFEHPLVVGPDGSAAPIEATLRDDMGTISASLSSTLLSSAQAEGTRVFLRLVPRSGSGDDRTAEFAADGTATMVNLPPGSYLAMATTRREQVEYRDAKVMAALLNQGQAVTLAPDGSTHVTLDRLVNQ